jgi:membrane-associated protease RseP (regulator of RpoE activity)
LFILNPVITTMVNPEGVSFGTIQAGYPAAQYGLEKNVVYTSVNGLQVNDSTQLVNTLSCVKPGDSVTVSNINKSVTLVTVANPNDATKGYLGVSSISTNYILKHQQWWYKGLYYFLFMFTTLLEWVATLSLGIGLANLLPLGPVDGGRMLHKAAIDIKGKDKGIKLWSTISIITIVVMIILIFIPIIKHVLFKV